MGCANSKQSSSSSSRSKCKHCQSPLSPLPRRSYSMHVHHPPQVQADTYHVVALTSTTLGSLKLETTIDTKNLMHNRVNGCATITNGDGVDQRGVVGGGGGDGEVWNDKHSIEFSLGVIEAKTWSELISEKIPKVVPKTPTRTPPGEPETINAWEMMEGLDDLSPLRPGNHLRSFSFDVVPSNRSRDSFDRPKSRLQDNGLVSPRQLEKTAPADTDSSPAKSRQQNSWDRANHLLHEMENDNSKIESVISDFDPDVISAFRKSLEDLSPNNPFYLRGLPDNDKPPLTTVIATNKTLMDVTSDYKLIPYPKVKDKVIIYFTSLRGIRKTYEDCCLVRVIIKGFNVRVDERDVSMHSGFKDELKELMGDLRTGVGLNLPRVFVGRKYIGGAEDIRKLNEEGKLEKMFECCEKLDDDGDGDENSRRSRVCEACGDVRFVPCETCSGSCKIYYEGGSSYESENKSDYSEKEDDNEDDEKERAEEEEEDVEYGFRRCPDCNENGLIRCPVCCD